MDKVLKQYLENHIPLNERDILTIEQIAEFWAPDDGDVQGMLAKAMREAVIRGDLPGDGNPKTTIESETHIDHVATEVAGEPRYRTSVMIAYGYGVKIKRDDFKEWLKSTGEWPLPSDIPLSKWWLKVKPNFRKRKPPQKWSPLSSIVHSAVEALEEAYGKTPTAKQVWVYLKNGEDKTGLIAESDKDASRDQLRTKDGAQIIWSNFSSHFNRYFED